MHPRQILLTRLLHLEIQTAELKRDFETHFPHGEGTDVPVPLYHARSFPGGAIQSIEQDIGRLKGMVNKYLPRDESK